MASGEWIELHKLLLRQNRERIEVDYLKACERQIEHPVLVLLDLRDAEALAIAYTTGRRAEVDAQVAEAGRRGMVPAVIWPMSIEYARRLFAPRPSISDSLIVPPYASNVYHVVVVAGGGLSTCLLNGPNEDE